MKIDLSTCVEGQKLLSSQGMILTYLRPLPNRDYYDHVVTYVDGGTGTRTNDGFVYRNNRMEKYDHDIVEILEMEGDLDER
jgi:hypothetical protein